jgi:hypothetical protein
LRRAGRIICSRRDTLSGADLTLNIGQLILLLVNRRQPPEMSS